MLKLDLATAAYTPLRASSYIKLPKHIQDKKAVLNIQNDDQRCFLWSVLAALHPVNRNDHPYQVRHYKCYEQELNVSGIEFPMKVRDIPKFERQKATLSINIFGYEDREEGTPCKFTAYFKQ